MQNISTQTFFWRSIKIFTLFLLPTALAGWWWGEAVAIEVYAFCISLWLLLHLWQVTALLRWLQKPKLSKIPKGIGIWQFIFATLLRQSKSRKKRKRKINNVLQRFYRATAAMPNGVVIINEDGRMTWLNNLASDHFQLDKVHDIGSIFINLIRLPNLSHFLDEAIATEEFKITLPTDAGNKILSLHCNRFDKNLRMIISQDITHLEKLNTTRSDFVANVSHELRTPLTVINGFLETFAENPNISAEEQKMFIELMRKEGLRMQNLLNDLLILSRLENTDTEEEKDSVNLSELCHKLYEAGMLVSAQQHSFTYEIEENLWINGISQDLYNGLSNIIFNAVRYTPSFGTIHISLNETEDEQGNTKIHFAVRDNGSGIPSEHLPRLTERFYRVDAGRSRQKGGTGLGLAITKHVLLKHHTHLQIKSVVGEGSEFYVFFDPINPPVLLNTSAAIQSSDKK